MTSYRDKKGIRVPIAKGTVDNIKEAIGAAQLCFTGIGFNDFVKTKSVLYFEDYPFDILTGLRVEETRLRLFKFNGDKLVCKHKKEVYMITPDNVISVMSYPVKK